MILQKINFTPLYKKIKKIFSENLPGYKFRRIRKKFLKELKALANANFLCYQANMRILEERKKEKIDTQIISDMELQARTVGERRVKAKTLINLLLNKLYSPKYLPKRKKILQESWVTDDIVYSVGEMLDRLIIEFIKIKDYKFRLRYYKKTNQIRELKSKINLAKEWSNRVESYLANKLKEIDKKGYYECVIETRTYDVYFKNK